MSLKDKILEAVDAIISPPPVVTLQVLSEEFASAFGRPHLTKDQMKLALHFTRNWKEAWNAKNVLYTESAARKEWQSRIAAHDVGVEHSDAGLSTLKDRNEHRRLASGELMKKINATTMPIVKEALENFVESGLAWIKERSDSENTECAKFGLDFSPSPVLRAAQNAVKKVKYQAEQIQPSETSPGHYFEFIGIKLD